MQKLSTFYIYSVMYKLNFKTKCISLWKKRKFWALSLKQIYISVLNSWPNRDPFLTPVGKSLAISIQCIYSLSQATVSVTFWQSLTNIHIPVKEVQLKTIQGVKSKIFSLKLHLILPGDINMNETKFLTDIYNGKMFTYFLHSV